MEKTSEELIPTKETTKIEKKKSEDGKSLINQYKVIKRLGEGPLSVVKLIECQNTKQLFACKMYNKTILQKKRELIRGKDGKVEYKDSLQDVYNEIKIMKKLYNTHIIRLHEVLDDPNWHKIYLVIDYCEKGAVLDWNEDKLIFSSKEFDEKLPEEEIARILFQTVKGLEYLHKINTVHRDIKPQNLLQCKDGLIKLADFDVAAEITKNVVLNKTKGTLHFMSPELCKKNSKVDDAFIGYSSDIWALGVSLYCLTYYKLPFFDHSLIGLIGAIESKEHHHYPKEREISDELKGLIDRMLEKDPKRRITLKDVKNHDFFKKYGHKFDKEVVDHK